MLKSMMVLLTVIIFCVSQSFAVTDEPVSKQAQVSKPDTRTNVEKLSDPDPVVRRNAVIYLGTEKKKENFTAICKMLADDSVEVRRAAVNAIMISGDPGADSELIERFKIEDNTNVKINIVSALGEMRSKPAVEMLKNLLKDTYPILRNEAIRALGKINVPETYPQITAMLRDEAEGVKVMAAETVATLRIFSAVPDLIENLTNPASVVRRSAAEALGVLGDMKVVKKLEKLLNDTDKSVVSAAKNAIEKIKAKPETEQTK